MLLKITELEANKNAAQYTSEHNPSYVCTNCNRWSGLCTLLCIAEMQMLKFLSTKSERWTLHHSIGNRVQSPVNALKEIRKGKHRPPPAWAVCWRGCSSLSWWWDVLIRWRSSTIAAFLSLDLVRPPVRGIFQSASLSHRKNMQSNTQTDKQLRIEHKLKRDRGRRSTNIILNLSTVKLVESVDISPC